MYSLQSFREGVAQDRRRNTDVFFAETNRLQRPPQSTYTAHSLPIQSTTPPAPVVVRRRREAPLADATANPATAAANLQKKSCADGLSKRKTASTVSMALGAITGIAAGVYAFNEVRDYRTKEAKKTGLAVPVLLGLLASGITSGAVGAATTAIMQPPSLAELKEQNCDISTEQKTSPISDELSGCHTCGGY